MEDEIDLRVYVEILWRARYVVLGVTLIAAAAAFAVSRLLLPQVYEASSLLVVETPARASEEPRFRLMPDGSVALDAQTLAPVQAVALTPAGYEQIAESEAFQALLRERLGEAAGRGGTGFRLSARVVGQTNLLELTAEARDPVMAARRANEAAALLLQEVERLNSSRMERALALLGEQIRQSREALDQAVERLQAFSEQGPPVERLQSEQEAKLKLIAEYQGRLDALDVSLAAEKAKLEALQAQLAREPRTVSLNRALSAEGAALVQALPGSQDGTAEGLVNLRDEQLNPVYVELQKEVALQQAAVAGLQREREAVRAALERLTGELQDLTAQLVRAEADRRELSWQAETARSAYERAAAQYEAQKAALASRLGESTLTLVREAVPPEAPARPRPGLNAAVAGFLGLMASIFGAFVAELWRRPEAARSPAASAASGGGGS